MLASRPCYVNGTLWPLFFLRCDNHSLAFLFKDGANPPTAPSAACFVPSAESSHLVPASCCQLLPGQLPSQVSNRAHHALWHGRVRSTVLPNAHKPHRSNQPDETQRCCSLSVALLLGRKTCPACRQFKTAISWEYISEVGDATLVPSFLSRVPNRPSYNNRWKVALSLKLALVYLLLINRDRP